METPPITTDQAERLNDTVGRMLNYLYRLEERMRHRGFAAEDKTLYGCVVKAHDAVHSLFVETHYMRCKSGAGRPPRE